MSDADPFEMWGKALELDKESKLEASKLEFKKAGERFLALADERPWIKKALMEYTIAMDAFSLIQEGRALRDGSSFDAALDAFGKAAEILRATIHFGFMSSYVSALALLETLTGLEAIEDSTDAVKNAIALLEQSKLTLSFRDEQDPIIKVIDAYIKYSISKAFSTESQALLVKGDIEGSKGKRMEAESLVKEYEKLITGAGLRSEKMEYFPVRDWHRATHGAFVTVYPEADKLWLLNIGKNKAMVESLGNKRVKKEIIPGASISLEGPEQKGKLRLVYTDLGDKKKYDEGCLTAI
jgi:tetratricopeptide (TPR) repeat protein